MAWKDDILGESTLGGAPFFYSQIRASKGRRTIVTEFPDRDIPATEDMGRAARRWSVEAFVVGGEYLQARDRLVAVLEAKGPHVWVNPYEGEVSVVLDGRVDISESAADGGIARLSFALVESGTDQGVAIVPSPAAALSASAAAVTEAADEMVSAQEWTKPGVLAAVANAIGNAADALQAQRRKTMGLFSGVDDLTHQLSDLKDARTALASVPSSIMAEFAGLLGALASVIRDRHDADEVPFPGGEKALRVDAALQDAAALTAVSLETPPEYEGAPVDEEEAAAERVLQRALRATTIATYADLFAVLPLESTDDGAKILAILGTAIEALCTDPETSDEMFVALSNLRAALQEQVTAATRDLPTLTEYTPPATMPSLLISYLVHGDPTRSLEIVARNRIADPAFTPGGQPLQVLLDG